MTGPDGSGNTAALGEFGRISRLFRPLTGGFPGALDLADDAALLTPPPGHDLVVTTDAMVADVHFFAGDAPEDIAAKLLRVNLSDLAAMAAQPLAYTLIVSLPRHTTDAWVARFAAGLAADQQAFGLALVGGDSVSTAGPATFAVTAFGLVPSGQALRRAGARAGDAVFVTGSIGDAGLALKLAYGQLGLALPEPAAAYLTGRLRRPTPRIAAGLAVRGLASAGADVSDGLVADLGHIAEASGLAAMISAGRVPLSPEVRQSLTGRPGLLADLLTAGDDYELVLTAPAEQAAALTAAITATGTPVTEIGRMVAPDDTAAAGSVTVLSGDGTPLVLPRRGWTHF